MLAKKEAMGKKPAGGKALFMPPPEQEDGCIIDNLLSDIRKVGWVGVLLGPVLGLKLKRQNDKGEKVGHVKYTLTECTLVTVVYIFKPWLIYTLRITIKQASCYIHFKQWFVTK